MPRITSVCVTSRELKLRHPFATSRDAAPRLTSTCVRALLRTDDGRDGIGDAASAPYVTGETAPTLLCDMQRAVEALVGSDPADAEGLNRRLLTLLPDRPSARAGVEMALLRCRHGGDDMQLWRSLGGARRALTTDTTISITDQAPLQIDDAVAAGFTRLKVKVGGEGPEAEAGRLRALMAGAGHAAVRVDANQAFTAPEALEFIDRLMQASVNLEFVEQPVPAADLAALDAVAHGSPVPILADEAVLTPQDAVRVLERTSVYGVNVKLMKSGIAGALEIIALVQQARRRLMLGCMLESACGIACSVAVAAGTGAFTYVYLDSHMLLDDPEAGTWLDWRGPQLALPGLIDHTTEERHG